MPANSQSIRQKTRENINAYMHPEARETNARIFIILLPRISRHLQLLITTTPGTQAMKAEVCFP